MKSMKGWCLGAALLGTAALSNADDYTIDTAGAHAFVQFRVKHLGYSWLYGRFNEFGGQFTFDEKDPSKNTIEMEVDVTSVDTNHEKRDLHIRSEDFFNVKKFSKAKFVSTLYKPTGENTAEVTGNLTLYGATLPLTVAVEKIGGGEDPWGGYRMGFEGKATIEPEKWGMPITKKLGPSAASVELTISVEGIKKKK